MWIATEEEYFSESKIPAIYHKYQGQIFTADDIPGLPEKTYLQWSRNKTYNWKEQRDFINGYWRRVKMAENINKREPMQEKDSILEERQGTHGEFKDVAPISQTLKIYFRAQSTWDALTFVQQEALDNIAQKIARIFAGNHNFPDHWVDIQGYAKLAQQEIEKEWR